MREPGAAVLDDFVFAERRARRDHDERHHGLAPLLVRDADHRDLGHGGMREDAVFDLDRRHVLAARDDHVLLAVRDREVVLVVDRAAVAGVEPAVVNGLGRLLGLVPVAGHHHVARREHLAFVVDGEADTERRRAGASELLRAFGGRRARRTRRAPRFIVSSGDVSVSP